MNRPRARPPLAECRLPERPPRYISLPKTAISGKARCFFVGSWLDESPRVVLNRPELQSTKKIELGGVLGRVTVHI